MGQKILYLFGIQKMIALFPLHQIFNFFVRIDNDPVVLVLDWDDVLAFPGDVEVSSETWATVNEQVYLRRREKPTAPIFSKEAIDNLNDLQGIEEKKTLVASASGWLKKHPFQQGKNVSSDKSITLFRSFGYLGDFFRQPRIDYSEGGTQDENYHKANAIMRMAKKHNIAPHKLIVVDNLALPLTRQYKNCQVHIKDNQGLKNPEVIKKINQRIQDSYRPRLFGFFITRSQAQSSPQLAPHS